jgi:hypothetical protein
MCENTREHEKRDKKAWMEACPFLRSKCAEAATDKYKE